VTSEDDHIARYRRPPRRGQYKPGQSGNLHGRPKGSRNILTYVKEHLNKKIPVIEEGKTRKISRAEAIAIQLVNQAAKGEPKGLAAVISLTREFDAAVGELRPNVLARAEDAVVLQGIIARIRAGDPSPSQDSISGSSSATTPADPVVLSFPAIAEEPECVPFWTPYGTRRFIRQPGEALHPDREAVAEYEAMRRRIGLYNFPSQYQQRPIPISGNLVKREWLRSYGPDDLPRRFMRIVQSWDTAAKTSELNDYSVCTTWGVEGKNFYLIDVFRRRLNYPDLKRAIVSQAEMFEADKILIEDKSSGTQLIQDLQNDGLWKVVEYKPPPGADKIMRLHACSDRFESGRVVLPRNAPWLDEYILELIGFPGTKHDDQVDSTTQALDYLREPDLVATYVKAFLG